MSTRLHVIDGPDRGVVFHLRERDTLIMGRSRTSQLKLNDEHVSRQHCTLEGNAGVYRIHDTASKLGTFVNGQRVEQCTLVVGDVIQIGQTRLRVVVPDVDETAAMTVGGRPTTGPASPHYQELSGLVGKTVAQYDIGEIIASGHSGLVFRAKDGEKDRDVALKVLRPDLMVGEESMNRFVRAVKTLLPVRHPNLIVILGGGRRGHYCYYAMELVEGQSLAQLIDDRGIVGMLEWKQAFCVAVQMARALEAAYARQFIHRNLKPDKILIGTKDEKAKLGGLMLAKALAGPQAAIVTAPGRIVGLSPYTPPERTWGEAEVDQRSDIYGLGATLYATLTGRTPVSGRNRQELIENIRDAQPPNPKKTQLSIPDMFEGLIMRMLAKRPDDRIQTPAALLQELERIGKFHNVSAS